jgi:hypothetical protein
MVLTEKKSSRLPDLISLRFTPALRGRSCDRHVHFPYFGQVPLFLKRATGASIKQHR